MARRVILEVLATLVITVLIAGALFSLFALTDAVDPLGIIVDQVPRILFGLLGVALGLWAIMLVIGSIAHRYRAVGWRIGTHIVSLLVALIVNIVVLTVVSLLAAGGSGWELLLVGIAVAAGAVLLFSGVVAVLLVELVIVRPRRVLRVEPAGL